MNNGEQRTTLRQVLGALVVVVVFGAAGCGGSTASKTGGTAASSTGASGSAGASDGGDSADALKSATCAAASAVGGIIGAPVNAPEVMDHRPISYNCNYVRADSGGTIDGDINYSSQGRTGFDGDIDEARNTVDTDVTALPGYGDEAFVIHVKDLVHEEYKAYAIFNGTITINASVSSDHVGATNADGAKAMLKLALTTIKGLHS